MRSALTTTIVALYENGGLSVEEIAQDQSVDKMLVISTLLSFSPKFRDEQSGENKEEEVLVSKEELKGFLADYKSIAKYTDDENLRARCLKDLINVGLKVTDGLGEHNPAKLLKAVGGSGNIYNLNMIIQQARAAKAAVRESVDKILALDVESEKSA